MSIKNLPELLVFDVKYAPKNRNEKGFIEAILLLYVFKAAVIFVKRDK